VLPGSDISKIAPAIFGRAMFNTGQVLTTAPQPLPHQTIKR
jgi:hypothetical protein